MSTASLGDCRGDDTAETNNREAPPRFNHHVRTRRLKRHVGFVVMWVLTTLPQCHSCSHRTRAYSDSTLGDGPGYHKFASLNVTSLQAHWELLTALGDRGVAVAALQEVRHTPHQLSDLDKHLHRHGWKAHRGPPLSPGTRVVPAQNGKHQYVTKG
eukprot:3921702-Pyramimonas_sp.AAC.1